MAEFDLSGKVALVTGGSRGLGLEMVRAFASSGADVVVASRKEQACRDVAEEISAAYGVRALGVGVHVGDWNALERLADNAYDEFGHVDILVNNAGMSPLYPSLEGLEEQLWDKVLNVNLKGPFRLTTLIAPRMQAAGGGTVINISSIASVRPMPELIPYAVAKAGVNNLTQGLAVAYGPSVRVNCILAGPFLTDISNAWDDATLEEQSRRIPLGRAGNPEEIVGMALYLASDRSSYTTGAVLPVDGGYTAGA